MVKGIDKKVDKKTVYYKHVNVHNSESTLQELLQKAFSPTCSTFVANARMEAISTSSEVKRLVNNFTDRSRMFYGQLLMFEAGKSQELLTMDDAAQFYAIDAFTPDKINLDEEQKTTGSEEDIVKIRKKKVREFVNSFLYFSVLGNHLAVIQSRSLTSRELEAHLQWLLSDKAKVLSKECAIILSDKPLEATIRRIEKNPPQKILLGAPVLTGDGVPLSGELQRETGEKITEASGVKFFPKGIGFDLLKSLMGSDWFEQQEFSESLDDANLKVKLEVTYSRKTSKEGQKVLDSVATSLRHTDAADVKIKLKGGGEINGDELRVSGNIDVVTIKGKVDEGLLYDDLFKWLKEKIDDKEIDVSEDVSVDK